MEFIIKPSEVLEKTKIKINTNNSLIDIINDKLNKPKEFLLCPFFQLEYNINNKCLYTLSECKECALCEITYTDKSFNELQFTNYNVLLNEIAHIAYFLNLANPYKKYYSKVLAEGYSRNMVIDLVEIDENNFTLFKILNKDNKSVGKYKRAYKQLADDMSKIYPTITFNVKVLSKEEDYTEDIYSIKSLIER